jgi:hypothetical protein
MHLLQWRPNPKSSSARSRHIVPKERRVERLPSGYSVRESRDDSRGRYWYVVTALEVVMAATKERCLDAR